MEERSNNNYSTIPNHNHNQHNNPNKKKSFESTTKLKIHHILFISYAFHTASTTIPILLSPSIAKEYYPSNSSSTSSANNQISIFISQIVSNSVLGTSIGKFINGPICDLFGSRRISIIYSTLWIITVYIISHTYNKKYILLGCTLMEFFSSVQWPCYVNILAQHYADNNNMYEYSIYACSLGSRLGSLICLGARICVGVSDDFDWRITLRKYSCLSSFIATVVMVTWAWDSPLNMHDPINKVETTQTQKLSKREYIQCILKDQFFPSFKRVITSGVFWVVSIAHIGSSMIKSSERILGMYYYDTSAQDERSEEYSAMVIFLSLGFFFGLAVLGNKFTNATIAQRKRYILRWYGITIICCYALSLLGVYHIRVILEQISDRIVLWLQLLITFLMGSCIAVQYYTIPAIVATVFGKEKGMYASYTDGVACAVTSLVWKGVGTMVQKGNPQISGWSYGWAAVAIVLSLSALIMMEFLDYYFCFGRNGQKREIPQEEQYLLKNVHSKEFTSPVKDLIRRRWKNNSSQPLTTASTSIPIVTQTTTSEKDHEPLIVLHDTPLSSTTHQEQYLLQKRLSILLSKAHNQHCIDCYKPLPRWASIHTKPNDDQFSHQNIGCFICHDCAGIHINFQISHIKSIDFDSHWKEWEVIALERCGNDKIINYYPNYNGNMNCDTNMKEREEYIRNKYINRTGDLLNIMGYCDDDCGDENESDDCSSDDGSSILELSLNPSFSHNVKHTRLEVVHEEDSNYYNRNNTMVSPISMESRHTVVVDLLDDNFDL